VNVQDDLNDSWLIQFGQLLENRECFNVAEQNSTHFYSLLINLICLFFLAQKRVFFVQVSMLINFFFVADEEAK
jgi:hypothetical protein